MKRDDWMDIIGKIDPSYVQEAGQWNKVRHNRLKMIRAGSMAACVCLLLAGGIFSLRFFLEENTTGMEELRDTNENLSNQESALRMEKDEVETILETEEVIAEKDEILVNEVEQVTTIAYDMSVAFWEEITVEQMQDYYEVTLIPQNLPDGVVLMIESEETTPFGTGNIVQNTGEIKKEVCMGELAYNEEKEIIGDNNTIKFANADETKTLDISVYKEGGGEITFFEQDNLKVSVLNGTNVTIGYLKDSTPKAYMAVFEKKGVTFTIKTKGLEKEEVVEILRQIC